MENFKKTIVALVVCFSITCSYAQSWDEVVKIVASDRESADNYGISVAISGDYAIVGAYLEDHDASGSNFEYTTGSVYILKNTNGTWTQMQKLVASDRSNGDRFGESVDIDGNYVIVGAPYEDHDTSGSDSLYDSGSAYVFKNTSGTWSQVKKLVSSDRAESDRFGTSVAITGEFALVGAPYDDEDSTGANTKAGSGSVYLFKNVNDTWAQVQKIVDSARAHNDYYGFAVSMSGDYAIVGAPYEDHDENDTNISTAAGSAFILKNVNGTWVEVDKIVASDRDDNDNFARSVSISGDLAIVGARFEDHDTSGSNTQTSAGSAYIFKNSGGSWTEVNKIVASDRQGDDNFGVSVAIDGDYAIVGAYKESSDTNNSNYEYTAGSAYIFRNVGGNWTQYQKIVASDRDEYDEFGYAVGISGGYAIVGAHYEDHDTAGGGFASASGSAYLYSQGCLASNKLPTSSGTHTGSYSSTDMNGWTHYCSSEAKLLLSLKIGSSGAVVNPDDVRLKIGPATTYSWIGTDAGMIDTDDKGYQMIDRRWDVSASTQPSTGNVGVRHYFTEQEYQDVKDSLLLHGPGQDASLKSTVSSVTDLNMFKATTGAAFADPHTVSGITLINSSSASTSTWHDSTHGSTDHYAEFEVASFSGGGGCSGGGGGTGVAPLPVELIEFKAVKRQLGVVLTSWSTASEIDNSHFILQRSYNGSDFSAITIVGGQGTTNDIARYDYIDAEVNENYKLVYYRLIQVNFSGESITSPVVKVRFGSVDEMWPKLLLSPNPVVDRLNVVFDLFAEEDMYVEVFDLSGKQLFSEEIRVDEASGIMSFDLSDFRNGTYIVSIRGNSSQQYFRILKCK